MKYLFLLIPVIANAGGIYIEGEVFTFDDSTTAQDYSGLAPFASYAIKYKAQVSNDFAVSTGYKHQSSVGYRELGNGFNGPFVNFELRLF